MKKALLLGIAASFFFAFTFLLNRSMNLSGGSWIFSASFRFFFAYPILALIIWKKHSFSKVHKAIKNNPKAWFLWSSVGFGLFYAPLCYAGNHGESWLIAATWQITIVMGILLAPLFGKKIPIKNLSTAFIILAGVFLLQVNTEIKLEPTLFIQTLLPILIAAIAYPLGNRKMMEVCNNDLSTPERTYGMILCSLPFWLVLSIIGFVKDSAPSSSQLLQAFCVALFSGVIATLLFFKATDLVKSNQKQLAVIESTQAGEVIFTLLGGLFLLGDTPPNLLGYLGLILIIFGMILNSIISAT